ncbi:HAD hydrolase family protein [Lentibacillus salinarum]|uniref:HAD hydrolase family protein n=1 Tax=Lentibacillus salinarum TaxID=446820 RepID=A0ABW3ZWX2_9BACI
MARLIQRLQIPAQDIYAFGDSLNDIEMLQSVQNSVAMGNAPDIVKKAAASVTKDVNDDGIWYGLKMVGLLE